MSLSPGRDLDALIARRLWRAIVVHETDNEPYLVSIPKRQRVMLPHYSTNEVECQRVINHMRHNGWVLGITEHDSSISASFFRQGGTIYEETALTTAHAICLAALAALAAEG